MRALPLIGGFLLLLASVATHAQVAAPDPTEDAPPPQTVDSATPPPSTLNSDTPVPPTLTTATPFEDYLRLAALQNPGLMAAYERWSAAAGRAARAGGWPDPVFRYSYFIEPVQTAVGPQEHALGLSQRIPWFGKLGARGDAAAAETLAAEREFEATRLRLFEAVADAYYEYAYLAQAQELTRQSLEIVRFQEEVARARYRTEAAPYADVLKAQVELGVIEDRLRSMEDRRRPLAAHLNQVLGRELDAPLPWPASLDGPITVLPPDASVLAAVSEHNPQLAALEHRAAGASHAVDAAHKDGWPDFEVGIQTILTGESDLTQLPGQGKDAWIATLSLNLPLWRRKYDGAVQEAQATERAVIYRLHDGRRRLMAQAEDALFRLREAERSIEFYGQSLIPKAEQALSATSTAYSTGEAGYLDFADAQRTLLNFQLEHARALADRGKRVMEVATLMGVGVDEPDGAGTPHPLGSDRPLGGDEPLDSTDPDRGTGVKGTDAEPGTPQEGRR